MDLSFSAYERCELCPRRCGAARATGDRGVCRETSQLMVARSALHLWEEPPISGEAGSGTIFFSGCPLRCVAHSLARHGLTPQRQVTLSEFGVRRKAHEDFDRAEAERLLEALSAELRDGLTPRPEPRSAPRAPSEGSPGSGSGGLASGLAPSPAAPSAR